MSWRRRPRSADCDRSADISAHVSIAGLAAPVAGPAAPERFRGHIDRVSGGIVEGWCCDTDRPDETAVVEAVVSNGKRVIAVASLFRQDVLDAGFGNGRHGFRLDLAGMVSARETVIVRFLHGKALISKTPISFDATQAVLSDPLPADFRDLMRRLAAELRVKHADLRAVAESASPATVADATTRPVAR